MGTIDDKIKIEPKIKKLVDVLNKIDYIQTISSCEGHYNGSFVSLKTSKYGDWEIQTGNCDIRPAEIRFEIRMEKELEFLGLVDYLLGRRFELYPDPEYNLEISKQYHSTTSGTAHHWMIRITPFQDIEDRKKRGITDEGIDFAASAIEDYIRKSTKTLAIVTPPPIL